MGSVAVNRLAAEAPLRHATQLSWPKQRNPCNVAALLSDPYSFIGGIPVRVAPRSILRKIFGRSKQLADGKGVIGRACYVQDQ